MMIPIANNFPKKNTFWTKVASLTLTQLIKVTTAKNKSVSNVYGYRYNPQIMCINLNNYCSSYGYLPMHVRQTTFTAIGVGAHSSVNDSTTYSAKDRQTMASYIYIKNTYSITYVAYIKILFTNNDISYLVILVPGRVLL